VKRFWGLWLVKNNKLKKNYILVLPSWYPSKLDAFNGDFNERLVKSLKDKRFQIVLYVNTIRGSQLEELEVIEEDNLIVYKYYYKHVNNHFFHIVKIFFLYRKLLKILIEKYGLPQLVHTYVFYPAGLGVLYLKYKYKLKILLTEHWSLFSKTKKINIYNVNLFKKIIYRNTIKLFNQIICVSNNLKSSIQEFNSNAEYYVLPNTVDSSLFNLDTENNNSEFTFIHVSDGTENKNIPLILESFESCLHKGYNFKLKIVGKLSEDLISFINRDNLLMNSVDIFGMITYEEVALNMRKSNVFVLFSNYENMPCVILEALSCGLPVISSNVGGVKDVLNHENGIITEIRNLSQLENAMIKIFNDYKKYDRNLISQNAIEKYSYENISKKVDLIYNQILQTI
jgi:glycosyltransferase involved in cell wall biosynthesis